MRTRLFCITITLCVLTSAVYAVPPNPLENAYWRFEEPGAVAGNYAAFGADSLRDSKNANHLRWWVPDSGSALWHESSSGTVSGNTLTDTTKNWTPNNKWVGYACAILGVEYPITASTATTLTLSGTPPQGTQSYLIPGARVSGSVLRDDSKNWVTNQWIGYWCRLQGMDYTILANTQEALTLEGTPPQGTQDYVIWNYDAAPMYTNDVPAAVIPQTGESNTLALRFTPNKDIWTDLKNINNPIINNGFTLEAAFKPDRVDVFQAIIGKDGKPTGIPEQTLVLKIRGDTSELQIELFDKSGAIHGVRSAGPLVANQWYYAAVVNTGTTLSLYLNRNDGAGYVLQGTDPNPLAGALWEGTVPADGFDTTWAIGRGMYNGNVTDWFGGVIDEVRISNEALDPSAFLFAQGPNLGDFDLDGDVDSDDLGLLEACATGPGIPYEGRAPGACPMTQDAEHKIRADIDRDGDVDGTDFALLQVRLGA
jgi:hypothetical protein